VKTPLEVYREKGRTSERARDTSKSLNYASLINTQKYRKIRSTACKVNFPLFAVLWKIRPSTIMTYVNFRFIISLFAGENYLKQNVNLISADFGEQQMLRISFTREN